MFHAYLRRCCFNQNIPLEPKKLYITLVGYCAGSSYCGGSTYGINNKMERMRDLYREIKDMTGSYCSRGGAMKLSTGKVVTEGKEVKEIWQQYTEELYRRDPNATDSFNENTYEDEPEVMEIEVKEALRHI